MSVELGKGVDIPFKGLSWERLLKWMILKGIGIF